MKKRIYLSIDEELLSELDRISGSIGESPSKYLSHLLRDHLGNACRCCGTPQTALWMTSDECWRHYIPEPYRRAILCRRCWNQLVDACGRGAFEAKHVRARLTDRRNSTTNT
jgi:hypothetical protein